MAEHRSVRLTTVLGDRLRFRRMAGEEARYRATLRPWLWFLCRSADCRIFQEMPVPDIVRAIFDEHAGERVHVENRLTGSYATRTHCVRYRWDAGADLCSGRLAHTSFDFEKTRTNLLTRRDRSPAQAAWAEGEL